MPETPTDSPSPASTSRPGLLDGGIRRAYEKTTKTVATALSGVIDARFGGGTKAFLMVGDEAADIAAPASRLLARHVPMPGGSGAATDLSDIVELAAAAAGYVTNAMARRVDAIMGAIARDPAVNRPDDQVPDNAPIDPAPAALPSWPGAQSPAMSGLT